MFSERDKEVIDMIGRRKMTIKGIALILWSNQLTPFDDTVMVGNSIRRIIKKCERYELKWTLIKERKNKKLYIKRGRRVC